MFQKISSYISAMALALTLAACAAPGGLMFQRMKCCVALQRRKTLPSGADWLKQ